MSRKTDILIVSAIIVLIFIGYLLARQPTASVIVQPPAPVAVSKSTPKPCAHYETIKSIVSNYDGSWVGTVVTITMTDGGSYQSKYNSVTNYVGQKICSTELNKL